MKVSTEFLQSSRFKPTNLHTLLGQFLLFISIASFFVCVLSQAIIKHFIVTYVSSALSCKIPLKCFEDKFNYFQHCQSYFVCEGSLSLSLALLVVRSVSLGTILSAGSVFLAGISVYIISKNTYIFFQFVYFKTSYNIAFNFFFHPSYFLPLF